MVIALLASHPWLDVGRSRASVSQTEITDEFWRDIDESSISNKRRRTVTATSYRTVKLKRRAFRRAVAQAPMELSAAADAAETQITLPTPEGGFSRFRIHESPIMDDALAARLPDMKTYQGQGVDDPTVTTRFDWSPDGLHAIVLSPNGIILIVPYASDNNRDYIVYYASQSADEVIQNECLVSREEMREARERGAIQTQSDVTTDVVSGTVLRTYRLAIAATGEFTQQYGGGSVSQAQSAITQNVNLISAIYRKELSVSFTLINNTSIIFTDPATDGYTNSNPGTMLNENQTKLDTVIGSANYDMGHVYGAITGLPAGSRSFSGIGGVGVACRAGQEGRGASVMGGGSLTENIFVNGIAHEFGHQLGATHTFNATSGSCASSRNQASAWEPGSGSTLMAYAICGDENLQPTVDQYFHTGSLEQIVSYVTGTGNCAAQSPTGNQPPAVDAGLNYTIPSRTPFELVATASDPDGDAITYAWEEYDTGAASPPNTDDGTRPIFRSYPPSPSPSRLFPSLKYILNNDNNPPQTYTLSGKVYTTGEAQPTANRTMNFRATVRDNRAAGGGVQSDSMQVTVVAAAGPFKITQPDTSVSWQGGSTQTVTWNVAGTNLTPISTANVRITLSTDGGNTFPTVLASSTPNDGSQAVTIPNAPASQARIKVEAVGSIFFDISNTNFTITAGTGCSISISPMSQSFAANGGPGSFMVTAGAGCNWSVINVPTWVTITSGVSGSGNGTVSYSVGINTGSSPRTGTLTIGGQTFTVYQGVQFADVPTDHPFYTFIGKLSARSITSGCGTNAVGQPLYCPDSPVTREQMAVFIIRALGVDPPMPASQRFADVGPERFGYRFIEEMARRGITAGCGTNAQGQAIYCPDALVTREQMAVFIIRALGEDPPVPSSQRFQDVPPTNPFYRFIDRMAVLGITAGCSVSPPLYCPTDVVTRGQMAVFLVRAFGL